MLAMVASTPKAAAGLAILRERSDMRVTLPGPSGPRYRREDVTSDRFDGPGAGRPGQTFFGSSYSFHTSVP